MIKGLLSFSICIILIIPFSLLAKDLNNNDNTIFQVGTGIYDITGPAAEQSMMGYGMLKQQTAGISQRLWARAFVIGETGNNKKLALVNVDLGQIFQGVKQEVIKKLQVVFGNEFRDENVLLTANHTHSGPGGYSTYTFYNLTTFGFSQENFKVITDGIVAAIKQAHTNLSPARIKIINQPLHGISNNRSPLILW